MAAHSINTILVSVLALTITLSSQTVSAVSARTLAKVATEASLKQRLDSVIDRAIAEKRIVGTVVMVARDGKIVYKRAAGMADREANRPMHEDSIFRLASMSKTIVTAAALTLVDQGKLALNDPVTKFLPDFKPQAVSGNSEITIANLLNHTAGLNYTFDEVEDGPYHKANVSDGLDQPGLTMAENISRIASAPLLFPPGSDWHYSLSIDVLGAVLEKVANKSLADIIKDQVTGPLAMSDTGFTCSNRSRLARPYFDNPDSGKSKMAEPIAMADVQKIKSAKSYYIFVPDRLFNLASFPSGGAGLNGTAFDYLNFLETIRTEKSGFLSATSYRLMKSNQTGDLRILAGPDWGFAFGAAVLKNGAAAKGPHLTGTISWGGVYGHHWFVDPQAKLSVVGLTNTTVEGMSGAFTKEITSAVYGSNK